jgi:hypothetical protein
LDVGTYEVIVQARGTFNSANNGIQMRLGTSGTLRASNPQDAAGAQLSIDPGGQGTALVYITGYPTVAVGVTATGTPTTYGFTYRARAVLTATGTILFQWAQNVATGTTTISSGFMVVTRIA